MADASPEEQFLVGRGLPDGGHLEMVTSIVALRKRIEHDLEPGDGVLTWEPHRSGVGLDGDFEEVGEAYRVWDVLFCHKRWRTGSLSPLKEQMKNLFFNEWRFCMENIGWAERCLLQNRSFLEYFALGAGLSTSG